MCNSVESFFGAEDEEAEGYFMCTGNSKFTPRQVVAAEVCRKTSKIIKCFTVFVKF